jgi:hypothetical protein
MTYYTLQDCTKTLEQMVECARKEAASRKRVYPSWVEGGRMTAEAAAHEIACMESIYYWLFRSMELHQASEEILALEEKRKQRVNSNDDKTSQQENRIPGNGSDPGFDGFIDPLV